MINLSIETENQTHVDTVTQLRVRTKSAWHIVTFLLIIRLMQEEKLGVYDIEMTHKPYSLFWLYMRWIIKNIGDKDFV